MLRYEDHGYCYTWELSLPDGFTLSKPTRCRKRNLYYRDFYLGTYVNEYNLWYKILEIYENPPIAIIPIMVINGQYNPLKATDLKVVKELYKANLLTYDYVYNKFEDLRLWLAEYRSNVTIFNHMTYYHTKAGWVDENGELVDNRKCHFKSTMEARLAYSICKCTISDVAEFSWGAVFECVGDLCYKLVRCVRLMTAAEAHEDFKRLLMNTKAQLISDERNLQALNGNRFLGDSIVLPEDRIHELYDKVEKDIPYNYLLTNLKKRIKVLKGEIVLKGCEWISDYIKHLRKSILTELQNLRPKHIGFTWNKYTQTYSPKYAAVRMNNKRAQLFIELFDKVLYGEISGYEAHLMFSGSSPQAIQREHNRYRDYPTPYVAYFRERHERLDHTKHSFTSAVLYVAKCTKALIVLGLRRTQDIVTAFNYGEGRYNVNINTYKVDYRGWKRGALLSIRILQMSKSELNEYMPDNTLHECIIDKINNYIKQNRIHYHKFKYHQYGDEYEESLDHLDNTRRPPTKFLKAIYAQARSYMAAFNRFRAIMLNSVAVAP